MLSLKSAYALIGVVLAATTGFLLYASHRQGVYAQPLFDVPMPLIAGTTVEGSFVPRVDDDFYIVGVNLQRTIPFERLSELTDSLNGPGRLDVSWYLTQDSRAVEHDATSEARLAALWGDSVIKPLGLVKLKAGRMYTLRAHVSETADELNAAHPHLYVALHPMHAEPYRFNQSVYRYAAALAAVLSLAVFALCGWQARNRIVNATGSA